MHRNGLEELSVAIAGDDPYQPPVFWVLAQRRRLEVSWEDVWPFSISSRPGLEMLPKPTFSPKQPCLFVTASSLKMCLSYTSALSP